MFQNRRYCTHRKNFVGHPVGVCVCVYRRIQISLYRVYVSCVIIYYTCQSFSDDVSPRVAPFVSITWKTMPHKSKNEKQLLDPSAESNRSSFFFEIKFVSLNNSCRTNAFFRELISYTIHSRRMSLRPYIVYKLARVDSPFFLPTSRHARGIANRGHRPLVNLSERHKITYALIERQFFR